MQQNEANTLAGQLFRVVFGGAILFMLSVILFVL